MYERFTDRARKVLRLADAEASRLGHDYLGTEHLAIALLEEGSGVAANVLKEMDISLSTLRDAVEAGVPKESASPSGKRHQTPSLEKVLEYAVEETRSL